MSKFPMDDPKNIWKNQHTEKFTMSAQQLRHKVEQRQSKARFTTIFSIIVGLVLCTFFTTTLITTHEITLRAGFGILSLWCLYYVYHSYRWTWPHRAIPDAALGTTMQFYRRDLEEQLDYNRHIWRRAGLPFCFLGIALIIVPELIKVMGVPKLALNVLPVCVLVLIWFAAFIPLSRRRRQSLRHEIEELRAFENENRS